ncbi:MAG: GNAT family N-acetyltransferase, partial [Desulfobacterales bacterium]
SNSSQLQPILNQHGFIYRDYLNYLIKLNRPPDDVFQSFGRRTRKHIRRELRRKQVIHKEIKEKEQLSHCYDLLKKSYRLAKVPLADRSLFEAAYKILTPFKMVRFTIAYIESSPIAVSVDLLYKDIIFGWYGGMNRSFASFMPSELITWNILKWGSENGFQTYDFGGAGWPEEEYGVRDFKAKFGGELVCFGRNICIHAPIFLHLSKIGYGILRPLLFAA